VTVAIAKRRAAWISSTARWAPADDLSRSSQPRSKFKAIYHLEAGHTSPCLWIRLPQTASLIRHSIIALGCVPRRTVGTIGLDASRLVR
jgi:hypothetical protein